MPKSSTADRIADLETKLARLEAAVRAADSDRRRRAQRPIRWARTAEGGTDYPNGTGTPDTYPIIFLDGVYTQAQGNQSPTWVAREAAPTEFVHNIAGQYYIPVDTVIPAWFDNGRWWTDWHYTNVFHVTLQAPITTISPGANGNVVLPTGQIVSAKNWSTDTTLTVGDKCLCWQDQFDDNDNLADNWYLIKTGGTSDSALVRFTSSTADGSCNWPGTTLTPSASAASCTNPFAAATACRIMVLNPSGGSFDGATLTPAVGTTCLGRYVFDFGGYPVYAVQLPSAGGGTRILRGTLESPKAFADPTASVEGLFAFEPGVTLPAEPVTVDDYRRWVGATGDTVYIIEDSSDPEATVYDLLAVKWDEIERVENAEWSSPDLLQWKTKLIGKDSAITDDSVIVTYDPVLAVTDVLPDSTSNTTVLQYKTKTFLALEASVESGPSNWLTLVSDTMVIDVLPDSVSDTTQLQKKTLTFSRFPTTNSDSAATPWLELQERQLVTDVEDTGSALTRDVLTIYVMPNTGTPAAGTIVNTTACGS